MAEGDDLQFQIRTGTESAGEQGNDRTQKREHDGDTTAANPKTLAFPTLLEFSVAAGGRFCTVNRQLVESRLNVPWLQQYDRCADSQSHWWCGRDADSIRSGAMRF